MDTPGPMTRGTTMRLFGYVKYGDGDAETPTELKEVSVAASPHTLRRMAAFLEHVADTMEQHGEAFGHEHLEDYDKSLRPCPAFVVVKEFDGGPG